MYPVFKHFRKYSIGPPVSIYQVDSKPFPHFNQNLYASKPAARNRPKTENFKSYETLGKIKQPIWREQHPTEKGLGPIEAVEDCGAKDGPYKNPEYYSYHNYTFYNLTMALQCTYQPQPSALEEKELPEVISKNCYLVEKPWDGGGSGKKNPPPRCGDEDCAKDSAEEKDGKGLDEKAVCEKVKTDEKPVCEGDKIEPKS